MSRWIIFRSWTVVKEKVRGGICEIDAVLITVSKCVDRVKCDALNVCKELTLSRVLHSIDVFESKSLLTPLEHIPVFTEVDDNVELRTCIVIENCMDIRDPFVFQSAKNRYLFLNVLPLRFVEDSYACVGSQKKR